MYVIKYFSFFFYGVKRCKNRKRHENKHFPLVAKIM